MNEKILPFVMCISIVFFTVLNYAFGATYKASVVVNGDQFKLLPGELYENATAQATFADGLQETGWGVLDLQAGYGKDTKDIDTMRGAGFLEGYLTAKHIWSHYQNMYSEFFSGKPNATIQKVRDFLMQQSKWTSDMISKHESSDPYWRQVSYLMAQYSGLYSGYMHEAKKQPMWAQDFFVVAMLNAVGDLIDLIKALDKDSLPDFSHMTRGQLLRYSQTNGHCSALLKVPGGFEDLFMSHSSWFTYAATNRIYKHYDFNLKDSSVVRKKISFPSYPGFIESLDDFYLLGDMVMISTTNNIYNTSLYNQVSPQSLLAWQRVRLAHMAANTGEQWFQVFKKYNSGTYNNQYMVVDLSKIRVKQGIDDGALWVIEQIPGLVQGEDQTSALRAGYWPSYNIPFYEDIYTLSGYPAVVEKHGPDFSYQLAPRAKIFRRDQATVVSMDSLKDIMRFNDFKNDEYSEGNPCSTICCRGDLEASASPNGCYDTKVTDFLMSQQYESQAINGPTLSHGLSPFSWTAQFDRFKHVGLPPTYNFSWLDMKPQL